MFRHYFVYPSVSMELEFYGSFIELNHSSFLFRGTVKYCRLSCFSRCYISPLSSQYWFTLSAEGVAQLQSSWSPNIGLVWFCCCCTDEAGSDWPSRPMHHMENGSSSGGWYAVNRLLPDFFQSLLTAWLLNQWRNSLFQFEYFHRLLWLPLRSEIYRYLRLG